MQLNTSPNFLPNGPHARRCPGDRPRRVSVDLLDLAAAPAPPGQIDAARFLPVDRVRLHRALVRRAGVPARRILRGVLRPRHIHPQPPHRIPFAAGRPGVLRRPDPAIQGLRRVSPLRPPPPRVQILVLNHQSLLHHLRLDLLQRIRRACILADSPFLLGYSVYDDSKAADRAYDQVQICPFLLRDAAV